MRTKNEIFFLDNFIDDPTRILKYKITIDKPLSFIQAFLSSYVGLGFCGGDRLNCENSKSINLEKLSFGLI
jgi:hypothetical protein